MSPALWLVIILMMYLAPFPFILSLRFSGAVRDAEAAKEARELEGGTGASARGLPAAPAFPGEEPPSAPGRSGSVPSRARLHRSASLASFATELVRRRSLVVPPPGEPPTPDPAPGPLGGAAAATKHLQYMVTRDIAWIWLGIIVICIAEGPSLRNPQGYDVLDVIFEAVSAYGNIGFSMGAPGSPASLSAAFRYV
eukprot:tig00021441_g21547.t1